MGRWDAMSPIVWVLSLSSLGSAVAQEVQNASVEQVAAMLQSIDPYRPDHQATGTVRVFGSTSMDALAHGWTAGFQQFHPQAKVEVSAAGSESTFEQLIKYPSAVGMLSRPVTAEELEMLRSKGLKKPVAFEVAREALAVYVHESNPVETISGEQMRNIFTETSNSAPLRWNIFDDSGAFSGRDIHVVSRTQRSGTQRFLADFVFRSQKLREGVSSHASNAQVVDAVSRDPLAIAVCGMRCNGKAVKRLQLTAGAAAVPSDEHAVLTGQYPLTRPLTVVVDLGRDDADAIASREFVHYGLCRSGQNGAILVGFFPVDLPLLRASLQQLGAGQIR